MSCEDSKRGDKCSIVRRVCLFSGGQVANLYHDASIGNAVNVIVTRLVLLTEDQVGRNTLSAKHQKKKKIIMNSLMQFFFLIMNNYIPMGQIWSSL